MTAKATPQGNEHTQYEEDAVDADRSEKFFVVYDPDAAETSVDNGGPLLDPPDEMTVSYVGDTEAVHPFFWWRRQDAISSVGMRLEDGVSPRQLRVEHDNLTEEERLTRLMRRLSKAAETLPSGL